MSDVDFRINTGVRDFLISNRPNGVPLDMAIRAMQDTGKVERPYAFTSCEDSETPHRKMRKVTFVLATRTRADDEEGDPEAGLNQHLVNVLAEKTAELRAALLPLGLKLRKFTQGAYSNEREDPRGRIYMQRWVMWVELV